MNLRICVCEALLKAPLIEVIECRNGPLAVRYYSIVLITRSHSFNSHSREIFSTLRTYKVHTTPTYFAAIAAARNTFIYVYNHKRTHICLYICTYIYIARSIRPCDHSTHLSSPYIGSWYPCPFGRPSQWAQDTDCYKWSTQVDTPRIIAKFITPEYMSIIRHLQWWYIMWEHECIGAIRP